MRLLIDGYNLLHATDLFGEGPLEGTLRGSREALLEFLSRNLSERERKSTTIIFDAAQAPPDLPSKFRYDGMQIWFARDYPDADTLMEEILDSGHSQRDLVVVSHDRRVQRAARSSGAKPIDSHDWFRDLKNRSINHSKADEKPTGSLPAQSEWKKAFQDDQLQKEVEQQDKSLAKKSAQARKVKKSKELKPKTKPASDEFGKGIFDPFPPGYGEDLLEED